MENINVEFWWESLDNFVIDNEISVVDINKDRINAWNSSNLD